MNRFIINQYFLRATPITIIPTTTQNLLNFRSIQYFSDLSSQNFVTDSKPKKKRGRKKGLTKGEQKKIQDSLMRSKYYENEVSMDRDRLQFHEYELLQIQPLDELVTANSFSTINRYSSACFSSSNSSIIDDNNDDDDGLDVNQQNEQTQTITPVTISKDDWDRIFPKKLTVGRIERNLIYNAIPKRRSQLEYLQEGSARDELVKPFDYSNNNNTNNSDNSNNSNNSNNNKYRGRGRPPKS